MKHILTKILSLCCVMALISTLSPTTAVSAEKSGDFSYTVLEDGTAEITDYTGSATELSIPQTMDDHTVTAIGNLAFYCNSSLTVVSIPNTVTCIRESAFKSCYNLTEIVIPFGVSVIKPYTFDGCARLENVSIPNSVTSIEEYAFNNCGFLKTVQLPDRLSYIGDGAFRNCYSLESIAIPPSVTDMGGDVFSWCQALTDVTLPNTMTRIYGGMFSMCRNLTSIHIPDSVTVIENGAFSNTGLTDITLPRNVTRIGAYAFSWCSSLTEFVIPKGVTVIEDETFIGTSLRRIIIPQGVTAIGTGAFNACALTDITLPDSVRIIDDYAFYSCAFKSFTVPDGVESIQSYAFGNCESLESVILPASVTNIGDYAFTYCPKLTNVFYGGNEEQWNTIQLGDNNSSLNSAYRHYNTTYDHWKFLNIRRESTCEYEGLATYSCPCGRTVTRPIPALGHNLKNNVCLNCALPVHECLASDHPYPNNSKRIWTVTEEGACRIVLTFSADTETELYADYIYIFDKHDQQIGSYTGTELAGQQVAVPGDTAYIQLVSDSYSTCYGFAVTDITCFFPVIGDLNEDGVCDAADATVVFYAINGIAALSPEQVVAADLNNDGKLNLHDAARLFYTANGLIYSKPTV